MWEFCTKHFFSSQPLTHIYCDQDWSWSFLFQPRSWQIGGQTWSQGWCELQGWLSLTGSSCGRQQHRSHTSDHVGIILVFLFLSDSSPIIGNPCQWHLNWLTPWHLVDLIDVTLACVDAYSKFVAVVSVADVDDENRVGNSLMQIWTLTFGLKATLLFRL